MSPISITGFAGANQAIEAVQLPDRLGQHMENAMPGLGDLRALNNHLQVATVPTSPQRLTIRRMGRNVVNDALYWLGWSTVVSATTGFGSDTTERTYYTGDGTPKWTNNVFGLTGGPPYPQAARELSVPAPTSAPVVSIVTDGSTGTAATRFYVQTFVNDLGWESAPSPLSAGLVCIPGAVVDITGLGAPPSGNYGFATRRIYRTQPGTGTEADFFFLRELPVATTSTQDDARTLGDLMATQGWLPPPSGGFGLLALWNSMMGMLSADGKLLYLCVPGSPYAYPLRLTKQLKDVGVTLLKWSQNLLVLTNGAPVLFQGQDPESLQDAPPRLVQACLSARGAVAFGHGAVWPSNEGLAYYGDLGQRLVTQDVLTPLQWRALKPETMVAGRWGRFYVASYDAGAGVRRGFMLDPLRPEDGIVFLSEGFDACEYDELADQLYILQGGNIKKFAGDSTRMQASYTSKRYLQSKPTHFGAAKVVATDYPLTVQFYAEGTLRHTRIVSSRNGFVLPEGYMAEDFHVRITTSARSLTIMRMAAKVQDLRLV
jgi:hypothetical protein